MVRHTQVFISLAAAASLSLSACGDSGSSNSSSSTTAAQVNTGSVTASSETPEFQISGVVTGDAGATLTLTGTSSNTASTDSSGNYAFASVAAGNYTVSPRQTGYAFSPVSRAEVISTASVTDAVFLATANTAPTYTISGSLTGSAVAGAVITLNGSNVGSTVTDLSGNYTFTGLVGGTYTVNATLAGTSFSSATIVSIANTDSAANNFTSTVAAAGTLAFSAVATLPQATVGIPYTGNLVESIKGGTAPYRYQSGVLESGTPPLGMIVNPNGDLTGTASVPGQYDFTVCAADAAAGTTACQATSITVVEPAPPSSTPTPTPTPTPAATVSVSVSPATITAGGSSTLSWSSTNATSCTASGGWTGTKAAGGSASVSPTSTTTYVMTCSGSGGIGKASVVITVNPVTPPPPAPTVTLTSSAATISAGSTSTLKWSSKNATSCVKSGGWSGTDSTSGSQDVSPSTTTTYSLACAGSGGTAQSAAKVNVAAVTQTPEPTATLTASSATITAGGASTLTWSSTNADSCLGGGAWNGNKGDGGSADVSPTSTSTYTLACSGAGGTATVSAKITVNAATSNPVVASGTSWIYYNGQFDWPGDWPFSSTTNYADTSGGPMSGAEDLKVTLTAPYGGWIPWAQNFSFNSAPYTKLTISLKPTMANQKWTLGFVKVGDVPVGIWLDLSNYGPAPVAGKWGTYTLPLSALGVLGQNVYKFVLQDSNGPVGNTWYVDNVGFVP